MDGPGGGLAVDVADETAGVPATGEMAPGELHADMKIARSSMLRSFRILSMFIVTFLRRTTAYRISMTGDTRCHQGGFAKTSRGGNQSKLIILATR